MKLVRLIVAAAAVLAIAIPSGVLATHSPNEGPKHDFAVGGGITAIGTRFGFAAQNTPDGRTHGHAVFNNPVGTNRQGHVTCLSVDGNRAVFEILDTNTDSGTPVASGFLAVDNGEPVGGVPVDTIQGRAPNGCTGNIAGEAITGLPLLNGNITIHDGTE